MAYNRVSKIIPTPIRKQGLSGVGTQCSMTTYLESDNVDRPVVRPGDLIQLPDGTQLLVGDVNPLGGVCDDCQHDAWRDHIPAETIILVRNVLET